MFILRKYKIVNTEPKIELKAERTNDSIITGRSPRETIQIEIIAKLCKYDAVKDEVYKAGDEQIQSLTCASSPS